MRRMVLAAAVSVCWHSAIANSIIPDESRSRAVTPPPRLSVEITHVRRTRQPGREHLYEIAVVNPGTHPSTNIIIRCALPPSVKFLQCWNDGRHSWPAREVVWKVARLEPGQQAAVQLELWLGPGHEFGQSLWSLAEDSEGRSAEADHTIIGLQY